MEWESREGWWVFNTSDVAFYPQLFTNFAKKFMSIQQELVVMVSKSIPDAIIKKVDKDNFLDIHLPSVNPKKGTHLFFNTSRNEIKLGYYCRDLDFVEQALKRSDEVEEYSQGVRLKGNPSFNSIDAATDAALNLLGLISNQNFQLHSPSEIEEVDSESPISLEVKEDFVDVLNFMIKEYKLLPSYSFVLKGLREKGYQVDCKSCWFYSDNIWWAENSEPWDLLVTHDGFYSSRNDKEFNLLFDWDSLAEMKIKMGEDKSGVMLGLFQEDGQFLSLKQQGSISLTIIYYLYNYVVRQIIDEFKDEPMIIWSKVEELGVLLRGFDSYEELYELASN